MWRYINYEAQSIDPHLKCTRSEMNPTKKVPTFENKSFKMSQIESNKSISKLYKLISNLAGQLVFSQRYLQGTGPTVPLWWRAAI